LSNAINLRSTKTELNVEKARIDQLSKLDEGSTTGDAELQDIRVMLDGNVAENAGDAVRSQIKNLITDESQKTGNTKMTYTMNDDEIEVPTMDEFNELKEDLIKQFNMKEIGINKCYYNLNSNNKLGRYESNAWNSTDLLPISAIKKVNTYTDSQSKPQVMFFESNDISSYISGITQNGWYEGSLKDLTPSNATYCIIQCMDAIETAYVDCTPWVLIAENNIEYVTHAMEDIAIYPRFYYIHNDGYVVPTLSDAWRSTERIPVENISYLYSFVDDNTKPVILFFGNESLDSYLDGVINAGWNSVSLDIPQGAKYCIVQCLKSEIGNANIVFKREKKNRNNNCFNVKDYEYLVTSENTWTTAIQYGLNNFNKVYIPYKETRYELDNRLLIYSGTELILDRNTEMYMLDGVGTCFIRNANMFAETPDNNIKISGGIWKCDTVYQGQFGNGLYCTSDYVNPVIGVSGMISMSGVEHFEISNLTISNCGSFGIQPTNCYDFHIHDIYFNMNRRDGVHITGNSQKFHVHDIHGQTRDDFIALNSWDWRYSTARRGTIKNGVIENLYLDGKDNEYTGDFVRFLTATADNTLYTVTDIVVRNCFGLCNNNGFLFSWQADTEDVSNVSSNGHLGNISIENVYAGTWETLASSFAMFRFDYCPVDSVSIKNVKLTTPTTLMKFTNGASVKKLLVDDLNLNSAERNDIQFFDDSSTGNFTISNSIHEVDTDTGVFISVNGTGKVNVKLINSSFRGNSYIVNSNNANIVTVKNISSDFSDTTKCGSTVSWTDLVN